MTVRLNFRIRHRHRKFQNGPISLKIGEVTNQGMEITNVAILAGSKGWGKGVTGDIIVLNNNIDNTMITKSDNIMITIITKR